MNNTKKEITNVKAYTNVKGFTLVELVIVIAVIAILAAVLIPTFSKVITKAKESTIKEYARNRYVEYFTEYRNSEDFVDDVIIKKKEIHCVVFINGKMQDNIYTLQEAINEIKTQLNNQELNAVPNSKYKDVLMLTEQTNNEINQEEIIGFRPLNSQDLSTDNIQIIIIYQLYEILPDFTYLGEYDKESQTFLGTTDLYSSTNFILEKAENENYWYIKNTNTNKYLYMDFSETEKGEGHIYLDELDKKNKDDYLWEIYIENNQTIIRTKKTYNNNNHYYLTYYQDVNQFRCHFGVKYPIKIYILMFYN